MNIIKPIILGIFIITTLQQNIFANTTPSYNIQNIYMFSLVPYIQFHRYSSKERLTSTSFEGGIRVGNHLNDWLYIEAGAGVIPSFKTPEKTDSIIIYNLTTMYKIPYTTFISKTENVYLSIGLEGKRSSTYYPLCVYSGICIDFNPTELTTTKAIIKSHTADFTAGLAIENKIYVTDKKLIPTKALPKVKKPKPKPTPQIKPKPEKIMKKIQEKYFRLVAGKFDTFKAASQLEVALANKDIPAYILSPDSKNKKYRVQLGYFSNKQNAITYQKRLAKQNYKTYID
jgi:hypothetical protein